MISNAQSPAPAFSSARPPGYFSRPLGPEVAGFYRENGYLVLENALSAAEIDELRRETARLCRNDDGALGQVAPAGPGMADDDAMRRILCLHFPHKLSKIFYSALAQPGIVDVLTRVVGPNVKAMQSMLFMKAAGKPGQAWHQDEDYIPTRDRSLIGAWIALDDATVENGCLWVLPGSQKRGILWPQKFHFDDRFDCARESYNFPGSDSDGVPVEVKTGSVVFFNGYLLHRSLPNRAQTGFRRSLVNHYMSAESLLPWIWEMNGQEKKSVALTDSRDIVLVAGEDPYAYKGLADYHKAGIRPDGQGGCADFTDAAQKELAAKNPRPVVGV
jgi:ectoine hydroxylase-related dioxygenase (phytanoyl-CoA dioxygenase family)